MKRTIFATCLLTLSLCAGCGRGTIQDKEFASLAALNERQKEEGFVPLGRFGDTWPATVVETQQAENEIRFTLASGAKQAYPGYNGYTLQVVRLKSKNGDEVVAVYRSEKKK